MITALSAVSQHPEKIKALFDEKERNSAGLYTVTMFVRGKPYIMTIDDSVQFTYAADDASDPFVFYANGGPE